MSHVNSVNKIALLLPSFETIKVGLCTAALVFTCSSPAFAEEEPQATSSLSSVSEAKTNVVKPATSPRGVGATGATAPSTATAAPSTATAASTSSSTATATTRSSSTSPNLQQSIATTPSVPKVGSTGAVNKDIRDALDSDAVAIDHSSAYLPAQDTNSENVRVTPSSEQVSSTIKERPKVYRDPYGNRLKEPPRKQSFEERSQEQARTDQTLEEQNLQRPTSSLTQAVSASESTSASTASSSQASSSLSATPQEGALSQQHLKSAVIYFSKPEETDSLNVDAMSGASTVMLRDGSMFGITEHQAFIIAKYTQADLYRLVRSEPYSNKHTDLIIESSGEMDSGIRPDSELIPQFDPTGYDVIFIGFPIWWSDMPMPLYTFFNDNDLSGKVVIPFCTYGNSAKSKIFTKISKLEPNANVAINRGLKTQRSKIAKAADSIVKAWLGRLDSTCFKGLLPPDSPAKPAKKSMTIEVSPSAKATTTDTVTSASSAATSTSAANVSAPTSAN